MRGSYHRRNTQQGEFSGDFLGLRCSNSGVGRRIWRPIQWGQSTRINIFSIFLIDFSIVLSALPSETDRLTEPGCPIARRIRSVDGNRLVAPLKHMPAPHVRAVPALAVSREQPLHAGDKIGLRCLKKQMEMVPHQHPRMDLPAMTFTNLPESVEKHLAVIVGDKHLRLPRCHVPSRDITHRHTEIEVGGPCGKLDPKHQQGKKNVNPCTLTPSSSAKRGAGWDVGCIFIWGVVSCLLL